MDRILTQLEKDFIDEHIGEYNIEEISKKIQAPLEAVLMYVSGNFPQEWNNLPSLLEEGPKNYSIQFALSGKGSIDIALSWPDMNNPEEFINKMSTLLHIVTSLGMKEMVAEQLTVMAQQHGMENLAMNIMGRWNELSISDDEEPCIRPREVLSS